MGAYDAARARAEYDPQFLGVRIHVSPRRGQILSFTERPVTHAAPDGEMLPDAEPLRLEEDAARAVYEALAEYFGGSGHDTVALRRDYDAERKRVDRFIDHLTGKP